MAAQYECSSFLFSQVSQFRNTSSQDLMLMRCYMSCKLLLFNFAEILNELILEITEAGIPAAGSHSNHSAHCTDMHIVHVYVHAYVKLRIEQLGIAQVLSEDVKGDRRPELC